MVNLKVEQKVMPSDLKWIPPAEVLKVVKVICRLISCTQLQGLPNNSQRYSRGSVTKTKKRTMISSPLVDIPDSKNLIYHVPVVFSGGLFAGIPFLFVCLLSFE